jgi:hypothetical protein
MQVFLYRSWQPAGYYYVVGPSRAKVEADCEMVSPMLYERSIPHDMVKDNMDEIPVVLSSHNTGLRYKSIAEAINRTFHTDPCSVCATRICGKPAEIVEDDKGGTDGP